MPDIFKLEQVGFSYLKGQKALSGIDLNVRKGELLSIIGSNGSGKSTLLHLLCALVFPTEGVIKYKDQELTSHLFKDVHFNRTFRSSIGYVFQNSEVQLFCPTVLDELIFGPLQLGYSKEDAYSRANEIMQMLNIQELKDRPSYMLSGGEKKRVAIGSVLTTNPELLVFDEPMSGLDPKTRSFVIDLIFRLNEAGKTIVIATHHLELVDHLQSNVAVLSENHTIEKIGLAKDILTDIELLINTNLISEHWHKHGDHVHKHLATGYLYHKH